jgi:hypothetical protein
MNFKPGILLVFLLISLFAASSTNAQEGPPDTQAEFEKEYRERITKDKLFGVYIPKNLDDAMLQLDQLISVESQKKIAALPEDTVCTLLHNRLGQWMITNWGFYGGSRISHYLRSAGVSFPDDMADFLLLAYHRKLNGKPYGIKDLAKGFRARRKQEHLEEIKEGKVIKEEKKQRPKPNAGN